MRKIVAGLHMSLDGVIESPEKWSFDYYCDEVGQSIKSRRDATDTLLLGRTMYQEFAAIWPGQSGEVADFMNNTPKLVASTTLTSLDWAGATPHRRGRRRGADCTQAAARPEHHDHRQRRPGPLAGPRRNARRVAPYGLPDRAGQRQAPLRRPRRAGAVEARLPAGLTGSNRFEGNDRHGEVHDR